MGLNKIIGLLNISSSSYLCTIHTLHKSSRLVRGPDRGLEEAVHVDVVHLDDARGTVWGVPADEDTLVELSLQSQLLGRRNCSLAVTNLPRLVLILWSKLSLRLIF